MNTNLMLASIVAGSIPIVTIKPFIKNPHSKSPRALWVIKQGQKVLSVERSAAQAIYKVEEEGWILQPD